MKVILFAVSAIACGGAATLAAGPVRELVGDPEPPIPIERIDKPFGGHVSLRRALLPNAGITRDEGESLDLKPFQPGKRHVAEDETRDADDCVPEYWKSFQFFAKDRLDRNGHFDGGNRLRALAHRAQMPIARLGSGSQDRVKGASLGVGEMPLVATGAWVNLGPSSQLPSQSLYNGPSPLSGRVNAVAYDPTNSAIMYAGTAGGGVWKSANYGQSWTPLSDNWPYLCVSSIAIDPHNPQTIYAGTGDFAGLMPYSFGIMKSTDGGLTWTNLGKSQFGATAVSRILIDPDNSQLVTVTTGRGYDFSSGAWGDWFHGGSLDGEQGGIWQSTDGGTIWSKTSAPDADWCGIDFTTVDSNGKRSYWAAGTLPQNGYLGVVYLSSDRGATWALAATNNAENIGIDIACSKIDHNTVYVLAPDSYPGGFPPYDQGTSSTIFKTTDAGLSWNDIGGGFPYSSSLPGLDGTNYNWSQGFYDFAIKTSTLSVNGVESDAVYVGLITVAMSQDGGQTWGDLGQCYSYNPNTGGSFAQLHVDQHAFAVSPTDPNTVLIGNDGGVFQAQYQPLAQGSIFSSLNKAGLITTQFYKIAVNPTSTYDVLGGAQDNGSPMYRGSTGNWETITGGDGGGCAIDPINPKIQYTSAEGPTIAYTPDGWQSGAYISDSSVFSNEPRAFVAPLAIGPKEELYTATDHLWRWTSTGGWVGDLGKQPLGQYVRTIATCQGSTRIYTGSQDGQIWTTPDAGATWREIDTALPPMPVVTLSPSSVNACDLLVGFAGYGLPHLWRCINTSAGSVAWTDVDGSGTAGLPDSPVNSIVRDPVDPSHTWYAGTDVGVFVTRNSGLTWSDMTTQAGLPNVQVTDLQTGNGNLYAATYGRGIWRIHLEDPASVKISAVYAPSELIGSTPAHVSVSLSAPAPFGGQIVNFVSSGAALYIPHSATVPNGSTSTSVNFSTLPVSATTPVTITVSCNGTKSATVNLMPGALLSVGSPTPVVGGVAFNATVSLTGATPTAATLAVVPGAMVATGPTVSVPAGAYSAPLSVSATPVYAPILRSFQVRYLTITKTSTFLVDPPSIQAFTVSPSSVRSGDAAVGRVVLNGPAPVHGWAIKLLSSSSGVKPPGVIVIPEGSTYLQFPVSTAKGFNGQATISAVPSLWGAGATAALSVTP